MDNLIVLMALWFIVGIAGLIGCLLEYIFETKKNK